MNEPTPTPQNDLPGDDLPGDDPAPTGEPTPRDAAYWAKQVTRLQVGEVPEEAINLNVSGKRLVGPVQGFGKLWQKTYRVDLRGLDASPASVIATWKQSFGSFWPRQGRFYGPLTSIAPGDVALLNLTVGGGMRLSTGVMVLYADEESFTFMNPEGHMFAGWITFSAAQADGVTSAQVQVLIRTNDPIYEIGMPLVIQRKEDRFWKQTLENLARHLGAAEPAATMTSVCVDKRRQWKKAGNIWHNAAVRTALYTLGTPFRAAGRLFRRPGGGQRGGE